MGKEEEEEEEEEDDDEMDEDDAPRRARPSKKPPAGLSIKGVGTNLQSICKGGTTYPDRYLDTCGGSSNTSVEAIVGEQVDKVNEILMDSAKKGHFNRQLKIQTACSGTDSPIIAAQVSGWGVYCHDFRRFPPTSADFRRLPSSSYCS